jgi:alginate O-acetyltransferase complex protein AlgJ
MSRKLPHLLMILAFILIISLPLIPPLPAPAQLWQTDCPAQTGLPLACWLKAWVKIPSAFNAYFSDHYRLHQEEVDLLESARLYLLNEKSFPNVLIGKEDWLYYTGENNIQDHECTMPFTQAELAAIRERLSGWNDALQQRGIRFYVVIAPNKESIYPQYLPDQVQAGVRACRIDQVLAELQDAPLNVLDLRSPLQSAAQTAQVYHRTDTHWNSTGALVASQTILARIREDLPDLSVPAAEAYTSEVREHSGDLAGFLPRDARFIEREAFLVPLQPSAAVFEQASDGTAVSSISGSNLPRAVIFCDSFADALKPYLSGHFSRVVYSRSFDLDFDLIEREQPDVVIFEVAQRYLTVLR